MRKHLGLAGALAIAIASAATSTPASAVGGITYGVPNPGDPVCIAGFQTIQHLSWILKCRKTVPLAQLAATEAQAEWAICNTNSYWNYGPAVTTTVNRARGTATVQYICGHVEG